MMKRILCLLLTLSLLLSGAVLFTSCGKKKIELKGYQVVCGSDASEAMLREITTFSNTLGEKTGEKVNLKKVKADAELGDEGDKEILIGKTNRPETAKALKKIKDHGYIITVIGGKIVIVGTTNLLTLIALDLFVDTYIAGKESVNEISIEKTEVEKVKMLEVTKDWQFVYNRYNENTDHDYGQDLVIDMINKTKDEFTKFSSIQGKTMKLIPDTETAEKEILIGVVERDEYYAVSSGMGVSDYGVAAKGGKILAVGLSDTMMSKAITLLKGAFEDSVCETEVDGEKKNNIFVPADFALIYTDVQSGIFTDFPQPEGLQVTGTQDVQDATAYFYEGADVAAYNTYCQDLLSNGYRLYGNKAEVENSIFATYVNETANLALTVSYNDFKHAEAQGLDYKKGIRVVAAKLDSYNLAPEEMFTQDLSYTKIQESSITILALSFATDKGWGNLYVVALEDGSYIVLDGGTSNTTDRDKLYNVLLDLYKRADHATDKPTKEDPIRIAAWYLTHSHSDHTGNMKAFINQYCANYNTYCVTVDSIITNFPSAEEIYNSYNPNHSIRNSLAELSAKIKDAPGEEAGMKYYRVQTGQRLWMASTELEVMFTHDQAFPRRFHWFNSTSTVIRMNMYHTQNGVISEGSKRSMLWLGDAQTTSSRYMRATYGEYLKSDMVQIAHHGGKGCEWELYELIAPMCTWWNPSTLKGFVGNHSASASAKETAGINYRIKYSIPNLKYCIVAAVCNYTLTLTPTGFDFTLDGSATDIFDAGDNKKVTIAKMGAATSTAVPNSGVLEK